jgi:hypothetical protein
MTPKRTTFWMQAYACNSVTRSGQAQQPPQLKHAGKQAVLINTQTQSKRVSITLLNPIFAAVSTRPSRNLGDDQDRVLRKLSPYLVAGLQVALGVPVGSNHSVPSSTPSPNNPCRKHQVRNSLIPSSMLKASPPGHFAAERCKRTSCD